MSDVWQLEGTPEQVAIVQAALGRCDYPFERLLPGLRAKVGKERVPVQWADLSRFGKTAAAVGADGHGGHDHDHPAVHDHAVNEGDGPGDAPEWEHVHVDDAHGVAYRRQVLGLAYYSGKVVLHSGLVSRPEVAQEVFLAEGAHMVDFFEFTDEMRRGVYNAMHPGTEQDTSANIQDGVDLGHGHGWFDVGGYRSWVGEGWMGVFVRAFSDVPVTIPFTHAPTPEVVAEVRALLTPTPVDDPTDNVWGVVPSNVFHSAASSTGRHRRVFESRDVEWTNRDAAVAAGRRPCKVCKP